MMMRMSLGMRWVNHAGDDCTSDTGFCGKMLKHGEKIGGKVVSLQRCFLEILSSRIWQ